MKFFVPHVTQDEQQFVYEVIRTAIAKEAPKLDDRRVFEVAFRHPHRLRPVRARVGDLCCLNRERIYMILHQPEPASYLVCTTTEGAQQGFPIVVQERDVVSAVDFH